jgi:GntR family transcriptional regulator, galactonate operon transcriptional repressor
MAKRSPLSQTGSFEGVIEIRGILGAAVSNLGTRIVRGDWPEGGVVTKEADLLEELAVSRSVIREAFRILGAKGMIRSRTSDGTRVQPRSEWRLLDPDVMDWRIRAGDTENLLRDLLKVRLVLEPGVAYNTTKLADDAARDRIHAAWQAKVAVADLPGLTHEERREQFIETDLEFHRAFLSAVNSELLDQLFAVIEAALGLLLDLQMKAKGYTTVMIGMEESHLLHEHVYNAFAKGDAAATQDAMHLLIQRAIEDAEQGFLLLKV